MELKKGNYDVAIGILKSGIYLAELLDYLGQNTRYLRVAQGLEKRASMEKDGK